MPSKVEADKPPLKSMGEKLWKRTGSTRPASRASNRTMVEKKGRTKAEVDQIISWLTGYSQEYIETHLEKRTDFQTARRSAETVSYNDVIRELLGLGRAAGTMSQAQAKGIVLKGVHFPEGTQFRVTYKGRSYTAQVTGGRWVGSDGTSRNSPSEAAHAITGNNVNGWRFWEAKRPSDTEWRVMDQFR